MVFCLREVLSRGACPDGVDELLLVWCLVFGVWYWGGQKVIIGPGSCFVLPILIPLIIYC